MTGKPVCKLAQRAPDGERGSVFIEALVAAAIVALSLGGLLRVVADGAARERGLGERREALLIAQSQLADVGAEIPLIPGRTSGIEDDLIWQVDISPYPAPEPDGAAALSRVAVSVRSRESGRVLAQLASLRLAPAV